MKKKTLKFTIFLLAMTGMAITQVQAQIWETPMEDNSSIVRRINDTTWLVYSQGKDNIKCFYRVVEGDTVCQRMELASSNVEVNDMEIHNGIVYICGSLAYGANPVTYYHNNTQKNIVVSNYVFQKLIMATNSATNVIWQACPILNK